jgi:hypothetical protein
MLRTISLLFTALLLALAPGKAVAASAKSPDPLPYRWVFLRSNLAVDTNVPIVLDILRRAKDAGYNGVVIQDPGFHQLEQMNESYFTNAETTRATAESLGLAIYPVVFNQGERDLNPNLAEGLPVRKAHYRVGDVWATLVPDPDCRLTNGNFKQVRTNRLEGWTTQTAPGVSTFADDVVYREDGLSLRLENFRAGDPKTGVVEIGQTLSVTPFRQYRVSVWVKTQALNPEAQLQFAAHGLKGQPVLWPVAQTLSPAQEWTQLFAVFNSLNFTKVNFRISLTGATTGKLWLDDAKFEEVGLLNVLRREGCPLIVESKTEDKKEESILYREGTDYRPILDEEMDDAHEPPPIRLLAGTRLREGDHLCVSYYHAVDLGGKSGALCLASSEVDELFKSAAGHVNALLQPKGFLLNVRDLRNANWCRSCTNLHLTSSALLGQRLSRCETTLRLENPAARVFVWGDLFDPAVNGKDPYYLTGEGGWKLAWKFLPKNLAVVNLNSQDHESVAWFARHDVDQILAGYGDGAEGDIRATLAKAGKSSRVVGVMYTTWLNNYNSLEAFAQAAWGPAPAKK